MSKRRVHDGIAGLLITAGVLLGFIDHKVWFLLSGLIGALLLQSAFTGFCPVYWLLDRVMPDDAGRA